MDKSIDFDQVAELYDVYVRVDFDVDFWIQEARAAAGNVLELMCGSGRIGLPLIKQGIRYTGVDYSSKLLERFRVKLTAVEKDANLIHADARTFDIDESFDLIFIGFHSLSEVLDNKDKISVLNRIRAHLKPGGRFTFSLHNPVVRATGLTGQTSAPQVFDFEDGRHQLEFSHRFDPPSSDGMVSGVQFYKTNDQQGRTVEQKELELRFHLISKSETESLIAHAGFCVQSLWGDYDRSSFEQASPFMIYQCTV